jgi:hypothetical protein
MREFDSMTYAYQYARVLLPHSALNQPSDEALSDQYQLTAL